MYKSFSEFIRILTVWYGYRNIRLTPQTDGNWYVWSDGEFLGVYCPDEMYFIDADTYVPW